MNIDTLQEQFGATPGVRFALGEGNLPRCEVRNDFGAMDVYLHGAHLAHWRPNGQKPVLWTSRRSYFEDGQPIRGGVPICFPWFGPHASNPDAPSHGFARTSGWTVVKVEQGDDGAVRITLQLCDSEATRELWPHAFTARYSVTLSDSLAFSLKVTNTDDQPMRITEALHTYLNVSDVREIGITGLEGVTYHSKVEDDRFTQGDEPIRFEGETDRVYLDTTSTCVLDDPGMGRKIEVAKSGSNSTVVWNPWIDKAARMPDFGDDEWTGMVCIETANALDNAITIEPGDSHELAATLRVLPRD